MMGIGFTMVLLAVGFIREILGTGIVFADMDLLFGPMAESWALQIFNDYPGFLIAVLPPGAFFATGFLIALKNMIDGQIKKREDAQKAEVVKGSKRVRTTGLIT